jgi:hypothetical protein
MGIEYNNSKSENAQKAEISEVVLVGTLAFTFKGDGERNLIIPLGYSMFGGEMNRQRCPHSQTLSRHN